MHSPGIKGCRSENMSRTVSAALEAYKLEAALPVVPPKDDHALPRSPVFTRNSAPAGKYAVVLFVVKVSVIIVIYMFCLHVFYLFVYNQLIVTVLLCTL